ncbi:ankyrin repeat-containing protein [Histoplasma capsulatum]|uniref:Ankyrin repeat-containing protein n=1 Tax=Ajellomyces capsulatus TaxID=5037 RepID=A0A8A1M0F4_AJECA|nr:ankyrin repeat-containing protein [Histoplasma capsulatum]
MRCGGYMFKPHREFAKLRFITTFHFLKAVLKCNPRLLDDILTFNFLKLPKRTWKTCNFDRSNLPVSQEMIVSFLGLVLNLTTRVDLPVHVRLRSAILWNDVLLVKRIIKNNPRFLENPNFDDKSNTSLHLAAIIGNLEIVKLLVSFGHDSCTPRILESGFDAAPGISVNTDGATPLHLAAAHSHTSCVQFLCTQFPQTIDRPDHNGATPLMLAAQNSNVSHPAQSTCLIPPKQRPRSSSNSSEDTSTIATLLRQDASVTLADNVGNTALHYASIPAPGISGCTFPSSQSCDVHSRRLCIKHTSTRIFPQPDFGIRTTQSRVSPATTTTTTTAGATAKAEN